MGSRILNITACCFAAVWPIALHGQGPNAQSVTQAVLDQHKSADPTNSARALTGKRKKFDISKIPPPSERSAKTSQRIRALEEKKKTFVSEQIKNQSAETKFVEASPGTSAAPDNGARVSPAGRMRSVGSPASMGRSRAAFSATKAEQKDNQDRLKTEAERQARRDWEKTDDGRTLRRLKAEVGEFDISDIPLPRSNPR